MAGFFGDIDFFVRKSCCRRRAYLSIVITPPAPAVVVADGAAAGAASGTAAGAALAARTDAAGNAAAVAAGKPFGRYHCAKQLANTLLKLHIFC